VGERNYRWFLAFLYLNTALMAYGVWAAGAVLWHDCVALKLFSAVFTKSGRQVKATHAIVAQYLLGSRTEVCMVGALCVVMGLLVGCFAVYHTCLAATNTTTNESVKWGRLSDYREGCVRDYQRAVAGIAAAAAGVAAAEAGVAGAAGAGAPPARRAELAAALAAAQAALAAAQQPPEKYAARLRAAGLPPDTRYVPRAPEPLGGNAYDRGWLANLWEMCAPRAPELASGASANDGKKQQ
jgi:hypothetical protein